ncbi:MAG TPA: iron chelate uptake ABC transporter family permease subunit [Firmicutes bacterium]|jgi:iron complex transport system permease protein|nr:iron chelate uptake ABC transporter family permease subunit [Bacillota bacterium]HHT42258.1 iron chelate uptake ABC transporter family permease subunit [Bacillota bacterium]
MHNTVLIILLISLSAASLLIGVSKFSLSELVSGDDLVTQIIILSRIPRLASIVMAGAALSISGLIMQSLTRNRFVSPTTAGTMEFARFGMLISLIAIPHFSPLMKMAVIFAFSLAGSFLFMGMLKRIKVKNTVFVPLLGLMLGNVIGSLTTFLAYRYDLVQNVSTWLMGNFAMITQGRYELLYLSIPLLVVAFLYANKFTIAGMGEDFAVGLGLNYQQVVTVGLSLVSLLSALVVITVGRIPFLGLIVPNIVAMYRGDNLRNSLSTTALAGPVFLLAADILGRVVIAPYEIPIGLTVGVCGSLIFLYLVLKGERK